MTTRSGTIPGEGAFGAGSPGEQPVTNPADALPSSAPVVMILVGSAALATWVGAELLAESYGDAPSLGHAAWAPTPAVALAMRLGASLAVGVALALLVRFGRARRWSAPLAATLVVGAALALIAARGPVYSPTQGLAWMLRLRHVVPADSSRVTARRQATGSMRGQIRAPVPLPPAVMAAAEPISARPL